MASRDFEVRIIGDSSKAVKAVEGFGSKMRAVFGKGEKDASQFKGVFAGSFLGNAFANVVSRASDAVGDFIGGSISQASDLHETMSAAGVIFGKNAAEISKWGDTSAKNLGLSKQKAVDAATSFGDMLLQLGFTGDAAVKSSTGIVQMAADLGSFKNLGTDEVLDMIAGAMRGEYDSLQRVIPNINAARVQNEALAETGKKNANQLTAQEKAQATLAIIQKDGARAAGDFARTSSGQANQSKILTAQMENQQAVLGAKLLPIWTKMQSFLINQAIPAITAIVGWMEKNSGVVKTVAIALGVLVGAVLAVNAVMWLLAVNPIVLAIVAIVVGIGVLIATIVVLVKNWGTVIAFIRVLWAGFVRWLVAGLSAFGAWWNTMWTAIGNFLAKLWNDLIPAPIRRTLNWIGAFIRAGLSLVSSIWSNVWGTIGRVVSNVWTQRIVAPIGKAWAWVQTVIRAGLTVIRRVWSSTWNGLVGIVKGIWNGVLGWVESGINNAINLINKLISGINSVAGVVGVHINLIPHVSIPRLATGTVTNGPMVALIGDNPGGREVVQPVSTYQDELRRAYEAGTNATARPSGQQIVALELHGNASSLQELFTAFARYEDGKRVQISKMGKQAYA